MRLTLLALVLVSGIAQANVNIQSNQMVGRNGFLCEQAGLVHFTVTDNDFDGATAAQPIYIRLRLLEGLSLSNTLVDLDLAGHVHEPIYLAVAIADSVDPSSVQLTIAPDALAIIRWRAGEDQIWLRLNQSSSSWIEVDGIAQAPSRVLRVTWVIGITGRITHMSNESRYSVGLANRPANARIGSSSTVDNLFVSTLLCLDTTQHTIHPDPTELPIRTFELHSYNSALGVTSATNTDDIIPGGQTPANFGGDYRNILIEDGSAQVELTPNAPGLGFTCHNAFPLNNRLRGNISFRYIASWPWFEGSEVILERPNGVSYGFPTTTPFVDNNGRQGHYVAGSFLKGGPLSESTSIALAYDDEGYSTTTSGIRIAHKIHVLQAFGSAPQADFIGEVESLIVGEDCEPTGDVILTVTIQAADNTTKEISAGPYTGSDQSCGLCQTTTASGSVVVGRFATYFESELPLWPSPHPVSHFVQRVNQL